MNPFPKQEGAYEENSKWKQMIQRQTPLYQRKVDTRSPFERDYTRILYSDAYKRLKHKTQVFYSPQNDHICTRIEHVNIVESISYTIAKNLGLNTQLTKVISYSHDLGHSPFGHAGERILSEISQEILQQPFWHEQNGLYLVDSIELLEDAEDNMQNLDLTYAVRDGIISHCGEIDENAIHPREEAIDLQEYQKPNQYPPYTWEACIVKIADKISYIRRDMEDALTLKLLSDKDIEELYDLVECPRDRKINNTNFINEFIHDLCENSSPEQGLCFSSKTLAKLNAMKAFNYEKIYANKRMDAPHRYFSLLLHEIFNTFFQAYDEKNTLTNLKKIQEYDSDVISPFIEWLSRYSDLTNEGRKAIYHNKKLYDITKKEDFVKAILTYISGMTDNYAIQTYNQLIRF